MRHLLAVLNALILCFCIERAEQESGEAAGGAIAQPCSPTTGADSGARKEEMNPKPELDPDPDPEASALNPPTGSVDSELEPEIEIPVEDIPEENFRSLAAAVIVEAIEDARSADIRKALDATLWLVSADFPWWAEWAGMPVADPLKILTNGRARTASLRRSNR